MAIQRSAFLALLCWFYFSALLVCYVTFVNDAILLNDTLVGTKGTELYLVRATGFIVVLKSHCLVPNTQFILRCPFKARLCNSD